MADMETIGLVDEIQALVCDKLQVVSYKWLSRNYLVSSNAAKRLLEKFVEKHGTGIGVVYSISGWLKNNPSTYHVKLVSRPKLEEAKLEFDGNCSVQVYSVQACIPKDPAALWNAEFVQAEELFKQPITVDNCLRDNRFCGVLNSFVNRNGEKTPVSIAAHQVNNGILGHAKSTSAHKSPSDAQAEQKIVQQSSSTGGLQSSNVAKEVKSESHGHGSRAADRKPAPEKEKLPQPLPSKRKIQTDRNSSGSSGLANLWGRASGKPKPDSASTETKTAAANLAACAEAQISASEALHHDSSDDDDEEQQVNMKRTANGEGSRKRRVVFDFSDEEDDYGDAVNLASPDPPKKQSALVTKQNIDTSKIDLNTSCFLEEKEDELKVKEGKQSGNQNNASLMENSSPASNGKKNKTSFERPSKHIHDTDVNVEDKVADPKSPKRKKVLKTRIDERGREVTEVVWERKEPETKFPNDTMKKSEINSVKNAVNRLPETNKSPAMGNSAPTNQAGKAGNKKAGSKDPKQGNILSFFKRA